MSIISEKLEDLRNYLDVEVHPVVSPDRWDVYSALCDMVDDIIALLKAQEPRVMSLEEAQATLHTERVVWTECEEKNGDKLLYAGLHMDGTDYFTMQDDSVMEETDLDGGMGAELYGKKYRFWTSQPSDELREVTPWQ